MRSAHLVALGALSLGAGCSSSGATFPSYTDAVQQATPVIGAGSNGATAGRALRPLDLTYATGWGSSPDPPANRLPEILAPPSGGPVTDIYEVIRQLDGVASGLGDYFDAKTNETRGCTPVAAGKTLTIPWFGGQGAFFGFPVTAGEYQCWKQESDGVVVFGRVPVASPPAGCTDPYAYNVMTAAYRVESQRDPSLGNTRALNSILRGSLQPCSGDVRIMYAQATGDQGGGQFSSRSEITGNQSTHAFSFRVVLNDRGPPSNQLNRIRIKGSGVSRGVGNTFILSAEDERGRAIYCLSPNASGSFRDATCDATLEAAYGAIPDYDFGALPLFADPGASLAPVFDTSSAAFGL